MRLLILHYDGVGSLHRIVVHRIVVHRIIVRGLGVLVLPVNVARLAPLRQSGWWLPRAPRAGCIIITSSRLNAARARLLADLALEERQRNALRLSILGLLLAHMQCMSEGGARRAQRIHSLLSLSSDRGSLLRQCLSLCGLALHSSGCRAQLGLHCILAFPCGMARPLGRKQLAREGLVFHLEGSSAFHGSSGLAARRILRLGERLCTARQRDHSLMQHVPRDGLEIREIIIDGRLVVSGAGAGFVCLAWAGCLASLGCA